MLSVPTAPLGHCFSDHRGPKPVAFVSVLHWTTLSLCKVLCILNPTFICYGLKKCWCVCSGYLQGIAYLGVLSPASLLNVPIWVGWFVHWLYIFVRSFLDGIKCFEVIIIWEEKWRSVCYCGPLRGTAAKCCFCLGDDYCSLLFYQFCSKYQCDKCAEYTF